FGANIGTCVTTTIAAIGKPREAMQAAMAHVIFNISGVLIFIAFIPHFAEFIRQLSPVSAELTGLSKVAAELPRQIANAHTVFNVFNLVLFLGFTNTLARIVLKIVPSRPPEVVPETTPRYLDEYYLNQPAMALERVRLELERIGHKVLGMIRDSFPTLTVGTRERITSLQKRDDEIDALTDAVALYLRRLSTTNMVEPQPAHLYQYLGAANYLENIADIVETGIAGDSIKRLENDLEFDDKTSGILKEIYKELYMAGELTLEALLGDDVEKAQQVIESKKRFNGMIEHAHSHLFLELASEKTDRLALYKLTNSTIENFRRLHNLFRRICNLVQKTGLPATEGEVATQAEGGQA
ncbi:MAG: Na/Pi symporter, partial [Thiohalobacterales bacterium]|nr:Na/Pi symporter [Thiohalobacterales bacterium]